MAQAIADANVNLPTGTLYGPNRNYVIQASGQLLEAEAYGPIVVAYRNAHTEWSGKTAQQRQEFKLGRIITFDNVAAQHYDVRPLGMYLIDARHQPILPQQRSEVEIRGEDEHGTVATGWQASKLHFVILHNRSAQTLYKRNYGEHTTSDKRPPPQRRCKTGQQEAE